MIPHAARVSFPSMHFRPLAPSLSLRIASAALVAMLLVAGCSTPRPAPVEDRAVTRTPPAPPIMTGPGASTAAPVPAPAAPAPVATYTVKRGDTLHQIALDNGLDYRELAAWNSIDNVNVIRVGQVLRLAPPGDAPVAQESPSGVATAPSGTAAPSGVVTTPLRTAPVVEAKPPASGTPPTSAQASPPPSAAASAPSASRAAVAGDNVKTWPKAIKEPYSDQAVRELTLAASAVPAPPDALAMNAPAGPRIEPRTETRPEVRSEPPDAKTDSKGDTKDEPKGDAKAQPRAPSATPSTSDPDQLDWAWPAKGKIISGFSDTANLKGIDIAGTAGQSVHASAAGRVVYAGSGLRGYGKLIIIKHNATYLSAYAHNREILVKEGQQVSRGQKIAEMGNTDADQVKLHFEIRRLGKPMDPTKFLPPA